MLNGVDVSEWQGDIDWAAAKATGKVDFVYGRATYGAYHVDPYFSRNHDTCKERDIPFGAYHFFVFGEDPNLQADLFLSETLKAGRFGVLLPVVDVEAGLGNVAELSTFIQRIEAELKGQRMVIYTDAGWWDESHDIDGNPAGMSGSTAFSGHPLWAANWQGGAEPYLPTAWQTWVAWQYSNEGSVAGIGNCDLDRCPDLSPLKRSL